MPGLLELVNPALDLPGIWIGDSSRLIDQLHPLVRIVPHTGQHAASHRDTAMYTCPAVNQDTQAILNYRQSSVDAALLGADWHWHQPIRIDSSG